jgi:acylphosphatase
VSERAVRVVVHGRVQGVWFRETTRRLAEANGVRGHVRNRADGAVEARFEGDAAAVERLVDYCRSGPPLAYVEHVDVEEVGTQGTPGFEVR